MSPTFFNSDAVRVRLIYLLYCPIIFSFFLTACEKGTVGKAWTTAGKCEAITHWLEKFNQEYPGGTFVEFANIFRDKYFIPVFGEGFREMTDETKMAIQKDVLQRCPKNKNTKMVNSSGILKSQDQILISIFGNQQNFSEGRQLVFLIGTLQTLEGQKDTILTETNNLDLNETNFLIIQNQKFKKIFRGKKS